MFKRFLFPDCLVRRGFIPAFRLSDYLDQLDVLGRGHIEFAGNILLLREREQETLNGDELVLQPCGHAASPAVIVSTIRPGGCSRQPFAAFDVQMRQLLRFAHDSPRDHRLEMNFHVTCGMLGLTPCEVRRRIVDQVTDLSEGVGIMLTSDHGQFDPEHPHALVAVVNNGTRHSASEQTEVKVLCRASTVPQLLGAWNAVIRRLRPQFRETEWNAAMLMTLLLDIGKGGASVTVNEHASGFTLPWAAPEWLEIPNQPTATQSFEIRQHQRFDVPHHHFWSDELPTWLSGRKFRLTKGSSVLNVHWM